MNYLNEIFEGRWVRTSLTLVGLHAIFGLSFCTKNLHLKCIFLDGTNMSFGKGDDVW